MAVGVANQQLNLRADIGVAEQVGRGGSAVDADPVALPLVAERAQAVYVPQCRGVSGQHLVFGGGARDGQRPRRRVIDRRHIDAHGVRHRLDIRPAGRDPTVVPQQEVEACVGHAVAIGHGSVLQQAQPDIGG